MRAIVYGSRPGDEDRAGRTIRALRLFGASALDLARDLADDLWPAIFRAIKQSREAVWLVRAGAWPERAFAQTPASATGNPVLALGAVSAAEDAPALDVPGAVAWAESIRATRGDFRPETLPFLVSTWLDERLVAALEDEGDLRVSVRSAAVRLSARIVHYPGLDVVDDDALRIAEVVTSAQQGGAERVALSLASGLRAYGLRSRLVTLGRPTRAAFEVPQDAIDLATVGGSDPDHRARRVARRVVACGFDLAHGHLLDRSAVRALSARGVPVALTVHNSKEAWPAGTTKLKATDVQLLIACARGIEDELRERDLGIPTRTVWNGVDFQHLEPDPGRAVRARTFRESLGFDPSDFVLLALANPRPQKRLHLLPQILRATREGLAETGGGRQARLIIAGSPSVSSPAAERSLQKLEQAIDACEVREHVRKVGSIDDVAACLLAADVLVSPSLFEGLSLAQIEALAAGRPIVVTDVGGAAELAFENPAVFLLRVEATPRDYARILVPLAPGPPPAGREPARRHFDTSRMVEGYARLLPRALRASRRHGSGRGLFLIANNFSTGGAQTSARRLLLALKARGEPVRAAVIEEQPAFPTPGRSALRAAGIEVIATPPHTEGGIEAAVSQIALAIDRFRPRSVLFWNVIPAHKILLADALIDVPLFDVSPGEMYFESLERYFAHPPRGLPYRFARDYGQRLEGVIVKYADEESRAEAALGAPVHVIPNGVPFEEEPLRARPEGSPVVIGTAARLDPRKHVDRLLRALRRAHDRLPPYVLRIAGGEEKGFEEYVDELRSLAVGLNVEFVGGITDSRVFLRDLDFFTLVAEPAGCPNASLEAMAQGLPVVATDWGGMREQIADGVTGRLVGREDEAGLSDALVQLALDEPRRKAMGKSALERARARFSMDAMAERYASICLSADRGIAVPAP